MPQIKFDPVIGPQLLETITSALYEDPIIIFREYVQNSMDAYNNAIIEDKAHEFEGFLVDIKIDRAKRRIVITDNGYGIPQNKFLDEMINIGASKKPGLKNQVGFRGIGRLSAMPLCERLTFTNKVEGLSEVQRFWWDGSKFTKLLNQTSQKDFANTMNTIGHHLPSEKYKGDKDKHFFKVEITGYKEEIADAISGGDFKDRLCMMLPLKYSPQFKYQGEIKAKYQEFMEESIDTFSIDVSLDGHLLYKPYEDKDVLESGIVFWELKSPSKKTAVAEKMGILWFSFNRKMTARKTNETHGILVRSSNMLMGNEYSLANAVHHSNDYVTTPREITQMLIGVTGEMLIHSGRLRDNARRDWFKTDEGSAPLIAIIVDFLKRLHEYRYAASRFFTGKVNKDRFINAFTDLTNYDSEKFVSDIEKMKEEIDGSKETLELANVDIPGFPVTIKRFYERLMKCLREYYVNHGELEEFAKVRAFIKKDLLGEQKD